MANEWDLNVLAAMKKYEDLQKNTSAVDNTVMPTSVADTYGLTKGGQKQQQPQSDLYALQEKKRIAALEAQKRSALASLKTEKQQINPAFNTALSNVAGQSARQARNLAEYLAQRGRRKAVLLHKQKCNGTPICRINRVCLNSRGRTHYQTLHSENHRCVVLTMRVHCKHFSTGK